MQEEGRAEYERRRMDATNEIQKLTDGGYGGVFHDIDSRAAVVGEMHTEALGHCRLGDTITPFVSKFVLKNMLRVDIDARLPPNALYRHFDDGVAMQANSNGKTLEPQRNSLNSGQAGDPQSKPGLLRVSQTGASNGSVGGTTYGPALQPPTPAPVAQPKRAALQPIPPTPKSPLVPSIELPNVSVTQVNALRERGGDKKRFSNLFSRNQPEELPGIENLQSLRDRDQVSPSQVPQLQKHKANRFPKLFLIDDSESMKEHQTQVLETLQALAYLVKRVDDDGLDMYFMSDPRRLLHHKESTKLVDAVKKHKAANVFMELNFQTIADKIIEKNIRTGRPISIYIFTDGNWVGTGRDVYCGVDKPIKRLILELTKRNRASNSVALQFIRFGDLPIGIQRLRKLDNMGKRSERSPNKNKIDE